MPKLAKKSLGTTDVIHDGGILAEKHKFAHSSGGIFTHFSVKKSTNAYFCSDTFRCYKELFSSQKRPKQLLFDSLTHVQK